MKTKAISIAELPQDFKDDLKSISQMPDAQLSKLVERLGQIGNFEDWEPDNDDLFKETLNKANFPIFSFNRLGMRPQQQINLAGDSGSSSCSGLAEWIGHLF